MEALVSVEFFDEAKQFSLRSGGRQDSSFGEQAQATSSFLLHADVNSRRGIFTDTNEDQTGLNAASGETRDALDRVRMNLFGHGPAVDEISPAVDENGRAHYGTA